VRPIGEITRGTTAHNRLRRSDRWIVARYGSLLRRPRPLVVDLGYGATPITTFELFQRLKRINREIEVMGIEIDPGRVAAAKPYETTGLTFVKGGFELPVPWPPVLVRAFNVLRQYGEADARRYWDLLRSRIDPDGMIVEGTCSEIGHRAVWVALDRDGPRTLTFAARFREFRQPSDLAERLPKALIHRNVPGQPIHAFLSEWDRAWAVCAPFGAYGIRQRWIETARLLARTWPVLDRPDRWRLGELTIAYPG
jgi:hypothetical protein